MISTIKRQLTNIFRVKMYDFFPAIKKAANFKYDYAFGNGKSGPPLMIIIDLTYRCNSGCKFCFLKDSVLNKSTYEITLKDIKKLLEETKHFKPSIFLTGGEPLLRKDIVNVVKLIKSYGLRCGITTKGDILLNKDLMKYLDYAFVSEKKINHPKIFSNYILTEDLDFNKVPKNAFIQHLSYSTEKDIRANKEFCKKYFPNITCSYFKREPFKEEFRKKLKDLDKRFLFKPKKLSEKNLIKWYSDEFLFLNECRFAWFGARVSPDGTIYPCYAYRVDMGNIRKEKFMDIWNNEKFRKFRRLLKQKKVFPLCNRCCKL